MNRVIPLLAFLLCGGPCVGLLAQSATIDNLGYLDPSSRHATAYGVSPDGATVTGEATAPNFATNGRFHAFRWTQTGRMQDLGGLAMITGVRTAGTAVAGNGVIVGHSEINASLHLRPFRLAAFGGMQALGTLGGANSYAADVSDDGDTIVGSSSIAAGRVHGFRWQGPGAGTMIDLGTLNNVVGASYAEECSADGSAIVGYSWNGSVNRACLFRPGQPPLDLGSLNGPGGFSIATGISAGGSLVVGYSQSASPGNHAFSWRQSTGIAALGTVDAAVGSSVANAVSSDGRVIVGQSANNSRPGGSAAVWIDGQPRQLWDLLVTDYGADPAPWTSFGQVFDVSRDGSVLVGQGTYEGATSAFRITLRQNNPPTIAPPTPVAVECNGGVNTVVLSAQANDPDATDRLTVTWGVGGVVRQTNSNVVPGSNVTFSYNYPDGATPVWIGVSDGKASSAATTRVTVVDTRSPIVVVTADVKTKVDRGQVFASKVNLGTPFVDDICDPAPQLTNDAKAKYRIGTTKVTWTVRDKAGNIAQAVQRVIVKNDPPLASAGSNVTQTTTAPSVKVKLNGSLSRDPNGHKLKYLWKAPGAKLTGAATAKPTGTFKVGTTRVTLTVTDPAGAKSTDVMVVKVRAARPARTAATLADASVRESQLNALDSYQRGRGDSLSGEGLSLAASALALGTLAGNETGANEEVAVSPQEMTSYLTLRAAASQQARMAGDRFYQSFLVSGDENALAASMYAYYGSGLGFADLASGDVHEQLVEDPGERDLIFGP
ncbi:MAG TPA: hypothetical protein VGN57_15815 [Pirellulaceae bacterium]|jgi:probable HAF family extracellular repeat protein|nr:hypothetical protein [Pirellulaceae bacterium]